ncbi:MarR family winged helix-turn-helix transcriptional regulator [Alkalihalobacterium chitinilyticum]|uniref:HTH-type transcriptional regulator SarZ n=1 Tax=Alkalihalobacterium chitinilyticum TaxID=2980103 RepID=A0ABT5VGD8_9BACI|nr:MarR family transcriptional regulator [Alkalihalobacterium chitinilyticum]MDE5414392.1 MarR family transcriptional regulator [Alkalihalobacterium chitinilyticum]
MDDFLKIDKQLCFAIYKTAGEFNKLYTSILQPFGLTYPQYLVLLALWEKDHVTMKALGEKINLGTGTLTPMIARMEKNGWVQKQRSTEDERKVYISLQQKGVDEKEHITQKVSEAIRTCNIKQEEYERLMQQLATLQAKLTKL